MRVLFLALIITVAGGAVGPAAAEAVRKDCSVKYEAAKTAGTLNGRAWPQFYSQCAAEAKGARSVEPAATPVPSPSQSDSNAGTPKTPVAPAGCHDTQGYYINSDHKLVHRPECVPDQGGETAICNDGSHSFSKHHEGTCSHHGGVKTWE